MRTKQFIVFICLSFTSVLVLSGCYTQVARPDRDEGQTVSAEPAETETDEEYQEAVEEESVPPSRTNVYVLGGYGYPLYYDPFWSPYAPWRSGIYVRIGYYRDPWEWCGTPWYYSWDCDYYYGWWPSHRYSYYYPRYYSHHFYGWGNHYTGNYPRGPVGERNFARRDRHASGSATVYRTPSTSRISLAKVRPAVYTRDGSGTFIRRVHRESAGELKKATPVRDSAPPIRQGDNNNPRIKGKDNSRGGSDTNSGGNASGGQPSNRRVRKQSPQPLPPASGTSGGSNPPPAKRSSGETVKKPSNSGSSGNSGTSGSSNRGSGSSSGGSNRRVRN
jgi:hypothetical protein